MGSSMDNLTTLHSKIYNMEDAVDNIVNLMTQKEPNFGNGKPSPRLTKNGNISISSSPRISYSSPRSSIETNYKNPRSNNGTSSSISMGTHNDPGRMNTNNFPKWFNGYSGTGDVPVNREKSIVKNTQSDLERSKRDLGKQFNGFLGAAKHTIPAKDEKFLECEFFEKERLSATAVSPQGDSNFEKQVNEFLSEGDVESAYVAVLCCGDDLSVIELMDVTGPVLHKLSSETASEVLRVMSVQPMDSKFLEFAMPWIQQVKFTVLLQIVFLPVAVHFTDCNVFVGC